MTDPAHELEAHIPALRRYARALTRDETEADDLVQDCLERGIVAWSTHRKDADARAWLFTILRNLFLNTLRQRARRGRRVALDTLDEMEGTDRGAERTVIARDALAAFDTLPEEHRTLLVLVGVEDLSYQQAAQVLGIPIGTVMSRLSRARARLRQAIETGERVTLRRVK